MNSAKKDGIALEDDDIIEAPVVINAAGPHSFVINEMAGVIDGMKINAESSFSVLG